MAKKRDSDQKDRKLQAEKAVSRRDFVKKGAAGVVQPFCRRREQL